MLNTFARGKPFQPSVMFVGKASSLPYSGAPETNIKLDLKGLPWTNTLAYYDHSYLMDIKSFITLDPEHN